MRISSIKNSEDIEFIEKAIKEMKDGQWEGKEIMLLEFVYNLGVKEGRNQVVKNSIEFISK